MHIVLDRRPDGGVAATELDAAAMPHKAVELEASALIAYVRDREAEHPRWVWSSTAHWYPALLAAGVRVQRCVDLALSHRILRTSLLSAASELAGEAATSWDDIARLAAAPLAEPSAPALFDVVEPATAESLDPVREFQAQQAATPGGPLRLLLAAESAGSLVAEEIRFTGMPWRADVHDRVLTESLGPRAFDGRRPARLEALAAQIRELLGAPGLNPDSQPELLAALRRVGLDVTSTRKWELRELDHPAIAPLLEYKNLYRLFTANGWAWLDTWVRDGRFRPDYVVGGVVTGRWATSGGGALQLPKNIRRAVVADRGWKLVVADAAQLEPRVLTGLASDGAMADAGRGRDLYDSVVAAGVVTSRHEAKVAMLGAMYGATTGDSARLMPGLRRAFPRAIALVDHAAEQGERGEQVVSRLGRTSPRPGASWREVQERASQPGASAADERRARSQARDWGRFTRNFVVQASAAEWALCWMAELRLRLAEVGDGSLDGAPHLVFFLHDEIMVHTPEQFAPQVERLVRGAAAQAGRLLFGTFPVDFPLQIATVDTYADAK
ncbi:bifunctional 3'-5' exonuclease/DNA polymerase [Gryllotalpicola protaetiae]|uniref:DNA-directed DNA polymerase n=1 Tax=Gryllotalpicola protaetiae TaxID=2419771 RepID=A0A387BQV7_9MICO|nr:bifunctional 3'-5' exonuclease/DNA polymerase [Gryllotalpicola protaetiae]AYG05058.1 bifunctional 3'-5' exonuclease/DNA polymerase [Gryllotalpicola protaetiae]